MTAGNHPTSRDLSHQGTPGTCLRAPHRQVWRSRSPLLRVGGGALIALLFLVLSTPILVFAEGYASVSRGVNISPSQVVLGQNFTITFELKEVRGEAKTFENIAIAILRSDDTHVFDFAMYNNVTIGAYGTWSRTATNYLWATRPPGTYKAVVRGKYQGQWFDFDTTGSGVNPRSFSAVAPESLLEIVDARDFRQGDEITTDLEKLADGGRPVHTVTADGVTKVLMRLTLDRPGHVYFTVNMGGQRSLGQDGFLRPPGPNHLLEGDGFLISEDLTIDTVKTSRGDQAFAVYEAPAALAAASQDIPEGAVERPAELWVQFLPSDGSTGFSFFKTITLVRPPIMLVHGLCSSKETAWRKSGFKNRLELALPGIRAFDFNYPNGASFSDNQSVIGAEIVNALQALRNEGIAVTQVDLFGHSMGGLLGRIWTQDSRYGRNSNYNEGDINKLVMIDSPNKGSWLAEWLAPVLPRSLLSVALNVLGCTKGDGAVEDLMTSSPAIAAMNAPMEPTTPMHAIIGDYLERVDADLTLLPGDLGRFFRLLQFLGYEPSVDIIPEASDVIVSTSSQACLNYSYCGETPWGDPPPTSTFFHHHMSATSNPDVVDQAIKLLNVDLSFLGRTLDFTLDSPPWWESHSTTLAANAQLPLATSLRLNAATSATSSLMGSTGIDITAPPDASIVSPGQVVTVTVEPADGFAPVSVWLVSTHFAEELSAAPFSFTMTIPVEAAGPMKITALGKDAAGTIVTDEITLNVQPAATLQSLNLDPTSFGFFAIGAQKRINVNGLYSDDVERDITGPGTGTTYLSNNTSVVTVDADGSIKAQGNGLTTVVVSNSGVSASIDVTVSAPPASHAGPDITVDEGASVVLDGTQSLSHEGMPLTYQWTQTAGPAVALSGETTPTLSFTAPQVTSDTPLTFQLIVTDGTGDSDPDSVTVLVRDQRIGPDLTGTWRSLTQRCTGPGARQRCRLTGSVQVRNQGNQKALKTSFLRFYLSADNLFDQGDTLLRQTGVRALKPGKSQGKNLSYILPTGQTASGKYVIAVIDATGLIAETDETNNVLVFGPIP